MAPRRSNYAMLPEPILMEERRPTTFGSLGPWLMGSVGGLALLLTTALVIKSYVEQSPASDAPALDAKANKYAVHHYYGSSDDGTNCFSNPSTWPSELYAWCCENYGVGPGAVQRSNATTKYVFLVDKREGAVLIAPRSSGLAMPAGIGGGMLYVPLLIVTHVADPRLAAVLAQPIIVGAAMAGNFFNIAWQLRHKEQKLLDGHLALAMIAPCLAGNLVGSIMNQLLPSTLIMILLLILAATTFQASARRALNMWRAENALRNNQPPKQEVTTRPVEVATASATVIGRESDSAVQTQPGTETREASEPNSEAADDTPYTHVSFFSESMTSDSDRTLTRRRLPFSLPLPAGNTNVSQATEMCSWGCGIWMKFLLVWLCMIFVVAIRGGDGNSILAIRGCSWEYWVVTATGFLLLMLVGALTRQPEAPWYLCVVIGALSAVVGIGGAIVLNPMMVKRGIEVQAATATASLMVLVMSTCSTALFLLGGFVPPMPAITLGIAAFFGSMCGKTVVSYVVSHTGRTSLLVIMLAGFIAVSAATVLIQGSIETIQDFQAGENPLTEFHTPC
eukprot:symbB.v1.2.000199.t2/scaffold21.1/size436794/18